MTAPKQSIKQSTKQSKAVLKTQQVQQTEHSYAQHGNSKHAFLVNVSIMLLMILSFLALGWDLLLQFF